MQRSLLQSKFEAIKKLGENKEIKGDKLIGSVPETSSFPELEQNEPEKPLSDCNKMETNIGFLMSKLSNGLGIWYIPKDLRK